MKKINLDEKIKFEVDGKAFELSAKEQILSVLSRPMGQGTTYDEMATIIPLINHIRSSSGFLYLEKAEHSLIVKYLKSTKWAANEPAIFEWLRSIIDAPDILVEEKTNG